jgi:uncharacterized protein (DUF111 family)
LPAIQIEAIGYGAGSRELTDRANVLRVVIGHTEVPTPAWEHEVDRVWILESDIDDATPQQLAACCEQLLNSGALDVAQIPLHMKKGRSGTRLHVLAGTSRVAALETILLTQTSSIGVRRWSAERTKCLRRMCTVETPWGPLAGKCAWQPNRRWRFAAEYDDVVRIAEQQGVSVAEVQSAALQAFLAQAPPPPPT